MCKDVYLRKFIQLHERVHYVLTKSVEFQLYPHIIEQVENLEENVKALIQETKKLEQRNKRYPLFEESFEDLKLDYFFILKLLETIT